MYIEIIQVVFVLFFSVVLHECAHGWVAYKLGDPTAKLAGRLTLNPIKHIDPFGTIILPVMLKLMGFLPLGWAKPVPVNFLRLRNPKRDMIFVALAGPATNIVLAVVAVQFLKLGVYPLLNEFLLTVIFINLLLAIFNLVPVPPLDGSRIVMGLLPPQIARSYAQIEPFGLLVVIILLNLGLLKFVWKVVILLAILLGVNPNNL
ncbi:MAG: site-2 protease family protein [Candidatus Omnitrophica bacterium]|nr:site-2 protease family protein [Candidatus Omnitrophota bacterium]